MILLHASSFLALECRQVQSQRKSRTLTARRAGRITPSTPGRHFHNHCVAASFCSARLSSWCLRWTRSCEPRYFMLLLSWIESDWGLGGLTDPHAGFFKWPSQNAPSAQTVQNPTRDLTSRLNRLRNFQHAQGCPSRACVELFPALSPPWL